MVIMSYSIPQALYLIPNDLKRSTIRQRSEDKERAIEKTGIINNYWRHRQSDQRHLGNRDLRKLTVINDPIIEYIKNCPPEMIYCEGFGFQREDLELFLVDNYDIEKLLKEGQFYMTEWWPRSRSED